MDKTRTIVLLLLFATMVLAPNIRAQGIIIPIPPNPPPSPQPPPQLLDFIVVDDDGAECLNADFITRDLSRVIDYAVDNATIVLCTGVYNGFSNALIDPWGQVTEYKPLIIKANGSVEIVYNFREPLGDIIFQDVDLILNSKIELGGKYVRLLNVTVLTTTYPNYYCIQEVSDFWSGISLKALREFVLSNTTLASTNCGVLKGSVEELHINGSVLDLAIRIRDAQLFVMYASVKTYKGSEDFKAWIGGIGLTISPSHPSLEVYATRVVIEDSKIYGTMYINSQTTVFKRNIVDYNASGILFNLPVLNLWTGYDGVIVDSLNYTIEYNVFKGYINQSRDLYGALRILSGVGVIRRNLFYDNSVALIIDEGSSPTVYDNVFIGNKIHMASIQYTEIASIDPPRPGPNVIGGPFLGGNYWDDYIGPDYDGDGLGDIPYVNDYNVIDIHPLTPWGLVKCPPYMGGYKLATSNTLYQLLSMRSLILLATLTLGVTITSNRRRFKGLMGVIGITTILAITIAVVVLVFQLSYNISTSILAKPLSPLAPLGTPLVADNRLYLTLYNPGLAPVCVKYAIFNSSKTILYPVQGEYLVDLATSLEDQILRGDVNYTLILEKLVNALIIEPKDSKEFTAYVEGVRGIADLSIVANNGVWRMHVFGED